MEKTNASRERTVEITESLLIDNPELATQSLQQLKKPAPSSRSMTSARVSSFSYLHRFPFDALKIDRVFVSAMSRSEVIKSCAHWSTCRWTWTWKWSPRVSNPKTKSS